MIIENDFLSVEFKEGSLPFFQRVTNRISGKSVCFDTNGAALFLGEDDVESLNLEKSINSRIVKYENECLIFEVDISEGPYKLRVMLEHELSKSSLGIRMRVMNNGNLKVFLKDIVMMHARSTAVLRGQVIETNSDLGEPRFANESDFRRIDAHPIFLDNHFFCGIDWPVAENAVSGDCIVCRQFCGDTVKPGEIFTSRLLVIGAAEEGKVAEAFLQHLQEVRGRKTTRSSMYFTWLTHAWEGLYSYEFKAHIDTFCKLKEAYGIDFDIFMADAGIVETLSVYYDRQRLRLDAMIPEGLKPYVEQLKQRDINFGIWNGPNGFGKTEGECESRINSVTGMVRELNIALIKLDVAGFGALGGNPYENEHYMRKLERMLDESRKVRKNLTVINHRITSSPYILGILDSTLWEGMETYPDVHLVNADKPRLFTRYASYSRGEPTYYGVYSELMEDCGVCFNGFYEGWAEEFVVHAFGRALMLSPEVYGTLFLLPDSEYPEMARLMKLSKKHRELLSHSIYDNKTGDFIHTDGEKALLCLINDSWDTVTKHVRLDMIPGLLKSASEYQIIRQFPRILDEKPENNCRHALWQEEVKVVLKPFGVAIVEINPVKDGVYKECAAASIPLVTLPEKVMDYASVKLGYLQKSAINTEEQGIAERIKFMISSDSTEVQVMKGLEPSIYGEINESRRLFLYKMKRNYAVAENAWDEDRTTAWGDAFYWKHLNNIWRIDLKEECSLKRVELVLGDIGPGTVIGEEEGRRLKEPLLIEASGDGLIWYAGKTEVFRDLEIDRVYTSRIIAEFPELPCKVRYLRMHVNGILVSDIKVKEIDGGVLRELSREGWHGNNLLTAREPLFIYKTSTRLDGVWKGRYLALIVQMPAGIEVPLAQEVGIAWVTDGNEHLWLITEASPAYPFNGWEYYSHRQGNSWTFRLPVTEDMVGKELGINLAWFGITYNPNNHDVTVAPSVQARLVTV